jgi:peptidoglycan/xylan/chitin deacetylase (PgdA/CDA1 family)
MSYFFRLVSFLILMIAFLFPCSVFADGTMNIPILCYHNFNPTVPGSMTLTPERLDAQFRWLKDNGYTFIPLQTAVEYLQGKRSSLPEKSVVITADDGWQSVYKYLIPLAKKYNIPVTLFIYPETISHGKNAMTWDELKELQATGLFDVQGHTYSHPNFKQAKRRMSSDAYQKFVANELGNSKKILEEKMGKKISYLAWPFGIYDSYLEDQAAKAGYAMAFTIDYRTANRGFRPMAQPRFMIIQSESMNTFEGLVKGANRKYYATGKNAGKDL